MRLVAPWVDPGEGISSNAARHRCESRRRSERHAPIEVPIEYDLVRSLSDWIADDFRADEKALTPEQLDFTTRILPRIGGVAGLTMKMWADEHPPPHFHVQYQGQSASFSILTCERLPGVTGLERHEKTIRRWWRANQRLLGEKWNASRPTNCPVGPIDMSTLPPAPPPVPPSFRSLLDRLQAANGSSQ